MSGPVWINEDDLSSLGWQVQSTKGLYDSVGQAAPVATIAGIGYGVIAGANIAAAPRVFSVTWVCSSPTDPDVLAAAWLKLKGRVTGKTVAVRHARRSNQQLTALCTGFPADPNIGPEFAAPYMLSVTASFQSVNPFYADTSSASQSIAFTSSPVSVPFGLADCFGVVTITNSTGSTITNPHLIQKNHAGTSVVDLPVTCSILAGDAIEIDGVLQRVRKRVSGTWTVATGYLASGFRYPRVTPTDGDYESSSWGTIQVSVGSGVFAYARQWP